MTTESAISADFPFESKYHRVQGSRMHYIEQGEGDPILFLHGNPTSSYLWRNIIPHLSPAARCIAPDLIGMGKSHKPDLSYRFFDHVEYVDEFIDSMGLENITLVIHDWGSALGFHYAMRHEHNIKGIAFMEAIIAPLSWADLDKEFRLGFKLMRTPGIGWFMISVLNFFVKGMLPKTILRTLSPEEMRHYEEPFRTVGSRRPVRQWPCEIPIDGEPQDVHAAVSAYNLKLQQSQLPKLLLHADPGAITTAKEVAWCREHLPNLTVADIGAGRHFIQEDHPHEIGSCLREWYTKLS